MYHLIYYNRKVQQFGYGEATALYSELWSYEHEAFKKFEELKALCKAGCTVRLWELGDTESGDDLLAEYDAPEAATATETQELTA